MYKKVVLISIIVLFAWIWKDYKKIDTSFVNQSSITYSYDNLNSNIIKKIHNYLDFTSTKNTNSEAKYIKQQFSDCYSIFNINKNSYLII